MDLTALIAAVESRLNRTDFTALIPSFIQRAEEAINARLAADPVRPMGGAATSTIAAGDTSIGVPDDFIDAIDLRVDDGSESWQLVRLDPSDPADYYATRSLPYATAYDSSKPRHYSVLGDSIEISAASDSELTTTLKYWQRLPALADGENWLSLRHAVVYEFATLAFAYKHERDDAAFRDNLDMAMSSLADAMASYPERQNPGELRSDLPTVTQAWSITNG